MKSVLSLLMAIVITLVGCSADTPSLAADAAKPAAPDATAGTEVRDDGLVATWYAPTTPSPGPALLVLGGSEDVLPPNPDGTDMAGATERLAHVREIMPEICTLDCGTMNFASGGDYIMVNTPGVLDSMAKQVQELGVRPELEVFDFGHLVYVHEMIEKGLLDDPIMIQLCMGIAYGAPDDPGAGPSGPPARPPPCGWPCVEATGEPSRPVSTAGRRDRAPPLWRAGARCETGGGRWAAGLPRQTAGPWRSAQRPYPGRSMSHALAGRRR